MEKAEQCYLNEPVSNVRWVHRDNLIPNNYNPNAVAPPELKLLAISILEDGWTQPIVVLPLNDGTYQIVDGFHRWTISGTDALSKYGGMVPIVEVKQDPVHQKMSTIRHNRARGTHGVLPMAKIVRSIIESGVSLKEMEFRLGMDKEEIDRLNDRRGTPTRVSESSKGFSESW